MALYHNRKFLNKQWSRISNSNHTAATNYLDSDTWIQIPDTGLFVKKTIFYRPCEMLEFWVQEGSIQLNSYSEWAGGIVKVSEGMGVNG